MWRGQREYRLEAYATLGLRNEKVLRILVCAADDLVPVRFRQGLESDSFRG